MGSSQAMRPSAVGALQALNGVCPYFTMFPLAFPMAVLSRAQAGETVFDPFCGRGTTGYAARLRGVDSIGIDSHPLAAAIAEAKTVETTPAAIMRVLNGILSRRCEEPDVPEGDFWGMCYHPATLLDLIRVRNALCEDCSSNARKALRAIMLGALHGPLSKGAASYLSNQAPRTYSPKPRYAVTYWRRHNMLPPVVDIAEVVRRRASRFFGVKLPRPYGRVIEGDSRSVELFQRELPGVTVEWIITSPPYYGLRTYRPDQWLRLWFLGGSATVDYSQDGQVLHRSPDAFAAELRTVWDNCSSIAAPNARMVVRFGGIADRKADPSEIFRSSINNTLWRIRTARDAGSASAGRRQATHFGVKSSTRTERDYWLVLR